MKTLFGALVMIHRIAIVGSGPSGLYTAKYLLERVPSVRIDVFEKLCTPFGLVRYGIAPDHQEAKNVASTLQAVLEAPQVRFFGNTEFGGRLTPDYLRKHYSGVVLASGATSERSLGIPGEDAEGVFSSRDIVSWYNAHPLAKRELIGRVLPAAKVGPKTYSCYLLTSAESGNHRPWYLNIKRTRSLKNQCD